MGEFEEEIMEGSRRKATNHIFDEETQEDECEESEEKRTIRELVFFDERNGFGKNMFHRVFE